MLDEEVIRQRWVTTPRNKVQKKKREVGCIG
jgi:hypothetical protein